MGCAASEAACICSRGLYWVPAPVRSCVYWTTGPLLRTAPWGRNKRAQNQHRDLTTARDCSMSHKTLMRSPGQAEEKHWPLTVGHWQSFESQPIKPGRFCCFCYIQQVKPTLNPTSLGVLLKTTPQNTHRDNNSRAPSYTGKQKCSVPTLGRVLACPLCFFSWVEAVEVFMLNMGSRRVDPR